MDFTEIFFNVKDYRLIKNPRVGRGNFGSVYKCENRQTHEMYAAKIIDVRDDFDGDDQATIMRESILLSTLHHPSIVKFYGISFRSFDNPTILAPTILTEFAPNASLKKILDDEKVGCAEFEWDGTKKYICLLGISNAMKYLHAHNILHLDLKPENVLVDKDYNPKICDFGLSRFFPESFNKSLKLTTKGQIGTPLYMAPEVLELKENYEYTKGVDVYAFSMLAYEIVTSKLPFYEFNKIKFNELKMKILKGQRPTFKETNVPEKMQNLIKRCWSQTIKERPSFEEIFHLLKSDFSYSYDIVNDDDVIDYLETIEDDDDDDVKNDEHKAEADNILHKHDSITDVKIQSRNEKNDMKAMMKKMDNSFFIVKFIIFDYNSLTYILKNEQKFYSIKDRDEYLNALEKGSKKLDSMLIYDNGTEITTTYFFDEKDIDITVYSVYKYAKDKFQKPFLIFFREYFNEDEEVEEEEKLNTYTHYFYPSTTMEQLFNYCYKYLPGKPVKLYLRNRDLHGKIIYDTLLLIDRTSISNIFKQNYNPIIYYLPNKIQKITNFNQPDSKAISQSTQKAKPKNDVELVENNVSYSRNNTDGEKIVIMKPLRVVLYDEKYGFTAKRITINQRSKFTGVLDDLLKILIAEGSIPISYFIHYQNDYVVEYLPKDMPIKNLPPNFNVQVKPHKGLPCRICILYRSPIFNDIFNINECFSFAIKFYEGKTTLDDIHKSIIRFLFQGKSERDCINKRPYQPSIFHDYNKQFIKIENINEIVQNDQKPIFVIWESPKVYDFVMDIIKKHLKEEKL